jgi:predicted GIY-YIG superfamily endonuclease
LLARLGKHTTGKGCLYIKKLADVDLKVLESLIEKAVAATRASYPKQA